MPHILLCGAAEMQHWPPCPHPDVENGICCTCEHLIESPKQ